MKLKQLIRENPFYADPSEIVIPYEMVWTQSSIKTFRQCKRKFFWKYILKLASKALDTNLLIGTNFHAALGTWYRLKRSSMKKIASKLAKEMEQYASTSADYYDQEEYEKLTHAIATFTGMCTGYAENYAEDRKRWQIVKGDIERRFTVKLSHIPAEFWGGVDLMIKDKVFKVVEHKTASNINNSYIDRLPMDTQVRGYLFGAQHLKKNSRIGRVIYNVTKKTKLRRKSNETADEFNERIKLDYLSQPDKYFWREELRFNKQDIDHLMQEIALTHSEYTAITNTSFVDPIDPWNWCPNDQACNAYFKTCRYLPLCLEGLDVSSALGYRVKETLHEELE